MSSKRIWQEPFIQQLHETSIEAPPTRETDKLSAIPIIHELGTIYLLLHLAIRDFEKLERYTLGTLMEKILLKCIETCFCATVAPTQEKYQHLMQASALFDTLKLYIRISIQVSCLQEKTYLKLIPHLGEIGRMLGGWLRLVKSQNPNPNTKSESNPNSQIQT